MTSHAHDPALAGADLTVVAPLGIIYPTQSAPNAVYSFLDHARRAGQQTHDVAALVITGHTAARLTYGHLAALLLERDQLLKRLDQVCPEHEACGACGTALCESCEIGEMSACTHNSMARYCVGCDIEACSECSRELRPFTVGGVR